MSQDIIGTEEIRVLAEKLRGQVNSKAGLERVEKDLGLLKDGLFSQVASRKEKLGCGLFDFLLEAGHIEELAKRNDLDKEQAQAIFEAARVILFGSRNESGVKGTFWAAEEALVAMHANGYIDEVETDAIIKEQKKHQERAGSGDGRYIKEVVVNALARFGRLNYIQMERLAREGPMQGHWWRIAAMKMADENIWDIMNHRRVMVGAVEGAEKMLAAIVNHPANKNRAKWINILTQGRTVGLSAVDCLMQEKNLSRDINVETLVEYYLEFPRRSACMNGWNPKNLENINKDLLKKLLTHREPEIRLVGMKAAGRGAGRSI